MASSNALAAIVLVLQSIPLTSGSYGGVTGLDSIARGMFKVSWSFGGQKMPHQLEEGLSTKEGVVQFALNSNHWILPYLLGKQPREAGQMVALSREYLIQTTALIIARFAIFLAFSMVVTLFHIFVVLFLFEDTLTKIFLIVGDIGRWLLVVGQLASVMTYSLDFKGVCSWAAPKAYGTR
ncbi:hypothetical protein J3R30DRAFT_3684884 [Lentinula aciculospora]|uniref:Uncharacterized protein n=1 Tax=Lentinula aciculospora TaxID=153920 RepID=A0A9W9A3V2_9AGAR|nr:hypothetical protein J3R30DRAFT_3684884 [Lentinula aciculospora]